MVCLFDMDGDSRDMSNWILMVVDMKLNINLGGHEWRDYLPILSDLSVISMAFKKTQSHGSVFSTHMF